MLALSGTRVMDGGFQTWRRFNGVVSSSRNVAVGRSDRSLRCSTARRRALSLSPPYSPCASLLLRPAGCSRIFPRSNIFKNSDGAIFVRERYFRAHSSADAFHSVLKSRSFSYSHADCHFGKKVYELEDTWHPDLGSPFGVMYCIRCECIAVSFICIFHRSSDLLYISIILSVFKNQLSHAFRT